MAGDQPPFKDLLVVGCQDRIFSLSKRRRKKEKETRERGKEEEKKRKEKQIFDTDKMLRLSLMGILKRD